MNLDLFNLNVLLSLLNILVLLICLYIIRDAVVYIRESSSFHSMSAILYLKSKTVIRGLRIVMLAIIVWSLKEVFGFMRDYLDFFLLPEGLAGLVGTVYEIVGLFMAILLSYGLYVISASFKELVGHPDEGGKPADI